MTDQTSFLAVGTLLQGKYRIKRHLASGGFGKTYLAYHLVMEREVVVKEFFMQGVNVRNADATTVSVGVTENQNLFQSQREKFKKEAQRLWSLRNEHIVLVHDLFDENDTSYYVMDFIDGESLNERMRHLGGPLPEAQVLDIAKQVLDALRTIHAEQLWHMDLKPANIMIDRSGRCRLIDFGSSKQTDQSDGNTSTALTYTPGYAPSEQVSGVRDYWGPWTDLYALGGTLYNLLSGNRPPLDVDINVKGDGAFRYPQSVSDRTKALVRWLMQPVYTQRPQSTAEVMAYLQGNQEAEPSSSSSKSSISSKSSETSEETIVVDEEADTSEKMEIPMEPIVVKGGETSTSKNSPEELIVVDEEANASEKMEIPMEPIVVKGGETSTSKTSSEELIVIDEDADTSEKMEVPLKPIVVKGGETSTSKNSPEETLVKGSNDKLSQKTVIPVKPVIVKGDGEKVDADSSGFPDSDNKPSFSPNSHKWTWVVGIFAVLLVVVFFLLGKCGKKEVKIEEKEGFTSITINGVTFNMMPVEGGTFTMGATSEQGSDANDDEKPAHQVTLSSYMIGETEVTQELWQAVMGNNPSVFTGDLQRPVECVSWDDCQEFISKLNDLTGKQFRLPTEAEWEFAARGGNKSRGYKYSGSNTLGNVAWYADNSGSTTHAVKTKSPNELGLYDMSGNVWEWCNDWYIDYYKESPSSNPKGPSSGSYRVYRGGSWGYDARRCRVSLRYNLDPDPDRRNYYLGLRLAL